MLTLISGIRKQESTRGRDISFTEFLALREDTIYIGRACDATHNQLDSRLGSTRRILTRIRSRERLRERNVRARARGSASTSSSKIRLDIANPSWRPRDGDKRQDIRHGERTAGAGTTIARQRAEAEGQVSRSVGPDRDARRAIAEGCREARGGEGCLTDDLGHA